MKKLNVAMWGKAIRIMPKLKKEEWDALDFVSKWLVSTRFAAIIMTVTTVVITGLLAARDGYFPVGHFFLLLIGLVFAHSTNNLLNDYTDYARGIDKDNYFREQYGPHPLGRGFMTNKQLLRSAAVNAGIAAAAGIALVFLRGGLVLPLMLTGAVFVLFYTWPFKYIALGELIMLVTWGPLMVGGGYYVLSGVWSWNAALAGLAYSLGVTATLFGKHIDKIKEDKQKGVHTMPVVLGEKAARYAALSMFVLEYLVVFYLMAVGYFSLFLLVVLLALPLFFKTVLPMWRHPRPDAPPPNYPEGAWPLWFVGSSFVYTRRWGFLYILGIILDSLYKWIF
jgi:1,4-dihydroxy-2-naphthoate octaprenyltransferase